MGNKGIDLMREGKHVLFAYEEAIGFMCGPKVLDKDGISAGSRIAEMAAYLETLGLSLDDKLKEIYAEYGHHISENSYWVCHEQETIKSIFERLRNYNENSKEVSWIYNIIYRRIYSFFNNLVFRKLNQMFLSAMQIYFEKT